MATATKRKKKADPVTPPAGRGGLYCTVGRAELLAAVGWARGAVAARTTVEALQLLHLEGHADGTLSVRATDLQTAAAVTLPADVRTPGAVLLPPDRLAAALDAADDRAVIDASDADTLVACGGKFTFKAHRLADCPPGPQPPGGDPPTLAFDAGEFAAAVHACKWAANEDANAVSRNMTTAGVYLSFSAGTLTVYGADGRRGAVAPIACTGPDRPVSCLLPVKPLVLFAGAAAGPATLAAGTTLVCLTAGQHRVVTGQLEGRYPHQAIDTQLAREPATACTVRAADWFAAVRRAATGCAPDWRRVTARVVSASELVVSSGGPHADPAEVRVAAAVEGLGESAPVVTFDPLHMAKAERACGSGDLTIRLDGSGEPFVLEAGGVRVVFAQMDENTPDAK